MGRSLPRPWRAFHQGHHTSQWIRAEDKLTGVPSMDSGSSVTWGSKLPLEPPLHLLWDKARAVGSAWTRFPLSQRWTRFLGARVRGQNSFTDEVAFVGDFSLDERISSQAWPCSRPWLSRNRNSKSAQRWCWGCHLVVWDLLIAFSVTKPLISTGSCVHMWVFLVA